MKELLNNRPNIVQAQFYDRYTNALLRFNGDQVQYSILEGDNAMVIVIQSFTDYRKCYNVQVTLNEQKEAVSITCQCGDFNSPVTDGPCNFKLFHFMLHLKLFIFAKVVYVRQ